MNAIQNPATLKDDLRLWQKRMRGARWRGEPSDCDRVLGAALDRINTLEDELNGGRYEPND